MSTIAGLLQKLEPESMMQEDGLKKAHLSLTVMLSKAATEALADSVAQIPGGVQILVQTSVLHPVPELRRLATAFLDACIKEVEPQFLSTSLAHRLPAALVRLLHEDDRRSKQEGFDEAVDPDLPVRRVAIIALTNLILHTDSATQDSVLDEQMTLITVLIACGNNDYHVRQGALCLAHGIADLGEARQKQLAAAADAGAAQVAASLLNAVCTPVTDGDEEGKRDARLLALQLILTLSGAETWREEMFAVGADAKLQELRGKIEAESSPVLDEAIRSFSG